MWQRRRGSQDKSKVLRLFHCSFLGTIFQEATERLLLKAVLREKTMSTISHLPMVKDYLHRALFTVFFFLKMHWLQEVHLSIERELPNRRSEVCEADMSKGTTELHSSAIISNQRKIGHCIVGWE